MIPGEPNSPTYYNINLSNKYCTSLYLKCDD